MQKANLIRPIIILLLIVFINKPQSFGQVNFDEQIKSLSIDISEQIKSANINRVAVADFSNLQGTVTELGRFIAEEFNVALAGIGQDFEVVDRARIEYLIQENKLIRKGFIDPETTSKLGKLAGIQALVFGTLIPYGDNIRISIKILNIEKGTIAGATKGNLVKSAAISDLLEREVSSNNAAYSGSGSPSQSNTRGNNTTFIAMTDEKHISKDCQDAKTGTIRIINQTQKKIFVYISTYYPLEPGDIKYIYDYREGAASYYTYYSKTDGTRGDRYDRGNIKVWPCEITNFEIKK